MSLGYQELSMIKRANLDFQWVERQAAKFGKLSPLPSRALDRWPICGRCRNLQFTIDH